MSTTPGAAPAEDDEEPVEETPTEENGPEVSEPVDPVDPVEEEETPVEEEEEETPVEEEEETPVNEEDDIDEEVVVVPDTTGGSGPVRICTGNGRDLC